MTGPGRPRVAVDLEVARALRGAGLSLREIAAALGVGRGTVARALAGVPKPPGGILGRGARP